MQSYELAYKKVCFYYPFKVELSMNNVTWIIITVYQVLEQNKFLNNTCVRRKQKKELTDITRKN